MHMVAFPIACIWWSYCDLNVELNSDFGREKKTNWTEDTQNNGRTEICSCSSLKIQDHTCGQGLKLQSDVLPNCQMTEKKETG